MKNIAFVLLGIVLLFGCVQQPVQPSTPAVVNVSQNVTTTPSQPVTVEVNQTTTQDTGLGTQDTLASLSSEEIKYKTKDSWEIHGTLYYAKNADPDTVVILLHQLGSDRSSYDPLIPMLHDALPGADILAIDSRGHGKSTNLGTYSNFKLVGDYKAMEKDIGGAVAYFDFYRLVKDNFYVVGASIGSTTALRYGARNSEIQKIVMVSPGMNYKGVDISEDLENYRKPLLVIAADGDLSSASDAKTIYSLSKTSSDLKKLQIYKNTSAHGTNMFKATETSSEGKLTKLIADWLKGSS